MLQVLASPLATSLSINLVVAREAPPIYSLHHFDLLINDVNNDRLRLSIVTPGMDNRPIESNGAGNIVDGESDKNIKFNVTFRKLRSTKSSKKG